jgi:hypothetical protein
LRSRQRIATVTTASNATAITRFQLMPWVIDSISGFSVPSPAQCMPKTVTSVQAT